jgi:Biopolymer transport protein ExbD/TolR
MRHFVRAEINVTPLVDVCLVLLIIFMLVTPLLTPPVQLPEAPEPEAWGAEPARSKVTVRFGPPRTVLVDDDPSPLDDEGLGVLLASPAPAGPAARDRRAGRPAALLRRGQARPPHRAGGGVSGGRPGRGTSGREALTAR